MQISDILHELCLEPALRSVQNEAELFFEGKDPKELQRLQASADAYFRWLYAPRDTLGRSPTAEEVFDQIWCVLSRYDLDPDPVRKFQCRRLIRAPETVKSTPVEIHTRSLVGSIAGKHDADAVTQHSGGTNVTGKTDKPEKPEPVTVTKARMFGEAFEEVGFIPLNGPGRTMWPSRARNPLT